MSIYLVPETGDVSALVDVLKRSQVPHLIGANLGKIFSTYDGEPVFVATVSPKGMLLLNRYPLELVDDLPEVILAVPNLVYTSDWISLAAALPPLDYSELAKKLAKSGATARDPAQLEKRTQAAEFSDFGFDSPEEEANAAPAQTFHSDLASDQSEEEDKTKFDPESI